MVWCHSSVVFELGAIEPLRATARVMKTGVSPHCAVSRGANEIPGLRRTLSATLFIDVRLEG